MLPNVRITVRALSGFGNLCTWRTYVLLSFRDVRVIVVIRMSPRTRFSMQQASNSDFVIFQATLICIFRFPFSVSFAQAEKYQDPCKVRCDLCCSKLTALNNLITL